MSRALEVRPSKAELNRKPIKFTVAGPDPKDEDQAREIRWHPQKVSSMMFSSGLLDDDTNAGLFGGSEQAAAVAGTKATRGMLDWFAGGLSADDEEWIIGRLRDPDDWLDFHHVTDVVKRLIEVMGDRPTSSR